MSNCSGPSTGPFLTEHTCALYPCRLHLYLSFVHTFEHAGCALVFSRTAVGVLVPSGGARGATSQARSGQAELAKWEGDKLHGWLGMTWVSDHLTTFARLRYMHGRGSMDEWGIEQHRQGKDDPKRVSRLIFGTAQAAFRAHPSLSFLYSWPALEESKSSRLALCYGRQGAIHACP